MAAYEFDCFRIDVMKRSLTRRGEVIKLPRKLFDLLTVLVKSGGQCVGKEELMQRLWPDAIVEENNLAVSISQLRTLLKDNPRRPKYILTVHRAGYRFVSKVRGTDGPRPNSLAVLPFSCDDPGLTDQSDMLTDTLIFSLSRLPGLAVAPRSTVAAFKGKEDRSKRIATKLGLRFLVLGRISGHHKKPVVTVQLLDLEHDEVIWGHRYSNYRTLSELHRKIVSDLTTGLTPKIFREPERGITLVVRSSEVYQLYLRGRSFWSKRSEEYLRKSIACFKLGVKKDPSSPFPYAGLADSYNMLGFYNLIPPRAAFSKAKALASKALAIDNSMGEAYASLGFAKLHYDWDWNGAEQALKTSIHLNPHYLTGRVFYGCHLVASSRFDEAEREYKCALEIDPSSLIANAALGNGYYFARHTEDAIGQCKLAAEMDGAFELAHVWLGWAYLQNGKPEYAIREFEEGITLSKGQPAIIGDIAIAYALSGRHATAMATLRKLSELAQTKYVSPYSVACIYVALGDSTKALKSLTQACGERSPQVIRLASDPQVDRLRQNRTLVQLLERVGLPCEIDEAKMRLAP
jgi:DNA-binding winged helix-turn-helix (wHTH) protein/tetratricopeptide (TPR) repeat protein